MLTDYYSSFITLERIRGGILAPYIEGFIERLESKGYTPSSVRGYLSTASHLGFWGVNQELDVPDLDDAAIQAFLDHLPDCRCFRANLGKYEAVPGHLQSLLEYLQDLIRGSLRNSPAERE